MARQIPDFPPLLACCGWWRLRIGELMKESDDERAVAEANRLAIASGLLPTREWMRFEVAGERERRRLSVPVAGGASALKNHDPATWRVSVHGDATAVLAPTLATLYGRTPWLSLLLPELPLHAEREMPASDYCRAIDSAVMEALRLGERERGLTLAHLRKSLREHPQRMREICRHDAAAADPAISVADLLFRLGPMALFALLPGESL